MQNPATLKDDGKSLNSGDGDDPDDHDPGSVAVSAPRRNPLRKNQPGIPGTIVTSAGMSAN
jgi:hypothetical protein